MKSMTNEISTDKQEESGKVVSLALTEDQQTYILLFNENRANVSATCGSMGIARQTFYRWCDNSDRFREEVEDIRESQIDWAEGNLAKLMGMEDEPSVMLSANKFYLSTIGRRRGYADKQDMDGKDDKHVFDELGHRQKNLEKLQRKRAEANSASGGDVVSEQ